MKILKFCLAPVMLISSFAVPVAHSATAEDAKEISRIYTAAFGRYPDKGGLNFWIDKFDQGLPIDDISQRFLESPEYEASYGDLNNTAYVEALFLNVLGREGEEAGVDFFTRLLDDGRDDRAGVLSTIADSDENRAGTAALFSTVYQESNGDWCFDIDGDGTPDNIRLMYWTKSDWGRANWN